MPRKKHFFSTAALAILFQCTVTFLQAQNTLNNVGLTSSTPAGAAYSLRKLSTSYSGNCVKLRRSWDNVTLDVGFTTTGTVDTSLIKSFVNYQNHIPNNSCVGAVAGTPGTLPTGWSAGVSGGLTRTIVGTGKAMPTGGSTPADSVDYIDIRFQGTPTATGPNIVILEPSSVGTVYGSRWTTGIYAALVGGSNANTFFLTRMGGGVGVQNFTPTSSLNLYTGTGVLTYRNGSLNIQLLFRFQTTSGLPIDFTIRLASPTRIPGGTYYRGPATTGTAVTTSAYDGYIDTWYDQSGNGRDLAMPSASQQYQIVASGQYLRALTSTTGNEYMAAQLTSTTTATPFSVFGAYQSVGAGVSANGVMGVLFTLGTTSGSRYIFGTDTGNSMLASRPTAASNNVFSNNLSFPSTSPTHTSFIISNPGTSLNDNATTAYIDGTNAGTVPSATIVNASIDSFRLGRGTGNTNLGELYEMLYFPKVLSAQERTTLDSSRTKYWTLPTGLSYSPLSSYNRGVTISPSITPTVSGNAKVLYYNLSVRESPGITFDTATGALTGKPTTGGFTSNYIVTAQNAAGSVSAAFSVTINNISYTWMGGIGNWDTASNWDLATVPGSADDIVISSGSPSFSTSSISIYNLTVNGTGSLVIPSSKTLTMYGSLSGNDGAVDVRNGTIIFDGDVAQTVAVGIFTNDSVANFTNTNNVNSLVCYDTITITGTLTNSTNGTFSKVTLASAATHTASLAGGGILTGSFTTQRYIPASGRRRYVLLTAPVNSPSIFDAWQEGGINTNLGFGTQVTGAAGTNTGQGFDSSSASTFASMFTFDDSRAGGYGTSKWVDVTNTKTEKLGQGVGYLIFMRGDRSDNRYTTLSSGNTVLRATGTIFNNDIGFTNNLTTGVGKFNLVGNPFACAINWSGVIKTNIGSSFYVYDPNQLVFVASNGTVKSPNVGQQPANVIHSGQAIFIVNDNSGLTPAITFAVNAKTTGSSTATSNTVFGNDSTRQELDINIYDPLSGELADGVVAAFDNSFVKGIAAHEDAPKMLNFMESLALLRGDNHLAIEARPEVKVADTLFLGMAQFQKKSYEMRIAGSKFKTGLTATLIDAYSNTRTSLSLNEMNTYRFTVNGDEESASDSRFQIVLRSLNQSIANETSSALAMKLSPNPVAEQLKVSYPVFGLNKVELRLVNGIGQQVKVVEGNVITGSINVSMKGLAVGIYHVQLYGNGKLLYTQKVVKQ